MRVKKTSKFRFILLTIAFLLTLLFSLSVNKPAIEGWLYVVNKGDKSIDVIDLKKNKTIAKIAVHVEPHEIAYLANGKFKRVITANYGNETEMGRSLTVINPDNNSISDIIDLGAHVKPHGISAIPNSNLVAVTGELGKMIFIVDIKKGKIQAKIFTNKAFSHLLAVHPKNPLLFVSNAESKFITVINWKKKMVVDSILCSIGIQGIGVTPNGKELWCVNSEKNEILIFSTTNQYKLLHVIKTGEKPLRIAFDPFGKKCIVSNAKKGVLSIYETRGKKLIKEIIFPGNANALEKLLYHTPRPAGVCTDNTGNFGFVSNSNASKVELIDLQKLTHLHAIQVGEIPDGVVFLSK